MRWLLALSVALLLAGCGRPSPTTQVDPNGLVEVAIPDHGAYTGAFMDFGDAEDDVTLETIEDFEEMVGKHQAIIVSSSYWGEQNFPRCPWFSGRLGTSRTRKIAARTSSV